MHGAADILHGGAFILYGMASILSIVPEILHVQQQFFEIFLREKYTFFKLLKNWSSYPKLIITF